MEENLPQRLETYDQEDESIDKFRVMVPKGKFLIRNETGGDYGVDLILELRKEKRLVTNFRTHIQMKSVVSAVRNGDGSFSFPVPITTLNYLMNQPNSMFVIYLANEDIFLWDWITNIFKLCRSMDIDVVTTDQQTISYRFTTELTEEVFNDIYIKINDFGKIERKLSEYLEPLKEQDRIVESLLEYSKYEDERIFGNECNFLTKPNEKVKLAQVYIKEHNYKKALEIFSSLASIYETEYMYVNCAMLSESIGKYMMAIKYADNLLRVNSKCFEAYFIKGTCLGRRKKYNQAIKNLEKALKIEENIETFHNLGYIYLLKGKRNIAIDYFNKCLEIDKDNLGAHLNIAIAYFNGFSNEIALYHINEAIRIDHKCYKALSVKGEILRYLGELDDAITCFNECLKYDSKNDQALFGAGLSLIENKNLNEGVIYLGEWLRNNKKRIFKDLNDKILIIDIGWKRTLILSFELVNSNTVNLSLNNDEKIPLILPSNKDYIFIGCIPIRDNNDEILFPVLGKVYENDDDYKKTIQEINKRVKLVNFFDPRRFITFDNDISVYLEEKKSYVYIELQFKDYRISGLTDTKSLGYYEFVKKYEEYKDIQINICNEEKKEEIVLSGITNVKIKKLK